jgi:RNA polymerase sigma-B factor
VLDAALLQLSGNVPPSRDSARDIDRETLIARYLPLCRRGARRFLRPGLDRSDLEQVARVGLVKASHRYDPARRTPFGAYAWLMILSELGHHVRDQEHIIRRPRRLRDLERRYADTWERLGAELEREPREREIATALRVSPKTVAELRTLHARESRLPRHCGSALAVTNFESRFELMDALRSLSLLERHVVFGLYWLESSVTGVGRRLGLSSRVVSEIHRSALARLRASLATESDCAP